MKPDVLSACLFVGLGGALGAVGRYLLSLVPIPWSFPVITMLTNFLGAVIIGAVVTLASATPLPTSALLFLKTGVCGGFTTFSTFSLETVTLLERGNLVQGTGYAVASVLVCLAGVLMGRALMRLFVAGT